MSLIPPETIEQIAAANDIVDIIGPHVQLKRAGVNWKGLCPFHGEKTPSFTVNPHRQMFKCFGCGAGGSVFKFVMEYEHVDFPTAIRRLAERAGIRIIEAEQTQEDRDRQDLRRRLLALHAEAADWFHTQLMKTRGAQVAREYLKGRGITGEIAKAWKLGYAPDSWDLFIGWVRERGYSRAEVLASGLVSQREEGGDPYDRFRNRVMFPICNAEQGEVIAFSGRVLEADPRAAKYVNSPETALFTKGAVLFGLHRSKRALIDKQSAIVCEGQLDLITAFEAGVQNVIAPQGTAFTDKQARILKRYVEEVVLCFDSDAAGDKAAESSLGALLAQSLTVRVAEMPPGEDPDSLIRGQGADAFRERILAAKDFFTFQVDRFAARPEFITPRGRVSAIRKVAGWAALISDGPLRQTVMNQMSSRLDISREEFAALVKDAPRDTRAKEEAPPSIERQPLGINLANLVFNALHDENSRDWLKDQSWDEVLEAEPDYDLLARVLGADITVGDSASILAFCSTLSEEDGAMVERIFTGGPLEATALGKHTGTEKNKATVRRPEVALAEWKKMLETTQDTWRAVEAASSKRIQAALQARMRTPGLPSEEIDRLTKELVDRVNSARDIARPSTLPR